MIDCYEFIINVKIDASDVDKTLAQLGLCWDGSKIFNHIESFDYPYFISETMSDFLPAELKPKKEAED